MSLSGYVNRTVASMESQANYPPGFNFSCYAAVDTGALFLTNQESLDAGETIDCVYMCASESLQRWLSL